MNVDETKAIAVIAGIAMDNGFKKQSFIQILDGKKYKARYHKFPLESFLAEPNEFKVFIGKNQFSSNRNN